MDVVSVATREFFVSSLGGGSASGRMLSPHPSAPLGEAQARTMAGSRGAMTKTYPSPCLTQLNG